MKIPEKIKISGYNYNVSRPEEAFVSGGSACDGLYDFSKQEIIVAKKEIRRISRLCFCTSLLTGSFVITVMAL